MCVCLQEGHSINRGSKWLSGLYAGLWHLHIHKLAEQYFPLTEHEFNRDAEFTIKEKIEKMIKYYMSSRSHEHKLILCWKSLPFF